MIAFLKRALVILRNVLLGNLTCMTLWYRFSFVPTNKRRLFLTWAWMMYRPSLTISDLTYMDELFAKVKLLVLHSFFDIDQSKFPFQVSDSLHTAESVNLNVESLSEMRAPNTTELEPIRIAAMVTSDDDSSILSDTDTSNPRRLRDSAAITPMYQHRTVDEREYEADVYENSGGSSSASEEPLDFVVDGNVPDDEPSSSSSSSSSEEPEPSAIGDNDSSLSQRVKDLMNGLKVKSNFHSSP